MYVLKKNMSSSAHYPYFVDETEGDRLMSSIDLASRSACGDSGTNPCDSFGRVVIRFQVVTFRDNSTKQLTMVDYLSIPPPRTFQLPNLASQWDRQTSITSVFVLATWPTEGGEATPRGAIWF